MSDTTTRRTSMIDRLNYYSLLNIFYHFIADVYLMIDTSERPRRSKLRELPPASSLTRDERICVYILSDIFLLNGLDYEERDRIASDLANVPFNEREIERLFCDEVARAVARTSSHLHPRMQRLRWSWVISMDWEDVKGRYRKKRTVKAMVHRRIRLMNGHTSRTFGGVIKRSDVLRAKSLTHSSTYSEKWQSRQHSYSDFFDETERLW